MELFLFYLYNLFAFILNLFYSISMYEEKNFDFTNPTENMEVQNDQKHNYKKTIKSLAGHSKISLHNAIIGFILLALLTLSLVYLLNQKEKVNIVQNEIKNVSSKVKETVEENKMPTVYSGTNYSIIFEKNPDFLLVKQSSLVDSTILPKLKAGKDSWFLHNSTSDQKVLEVETLENGPDLEFEKLVNEFRIKLNLNENAVVTDQTNQGFLTAKIADKYQIVQSKTMTYVLNLQTENKQVQTDILNNIQFN